MGTDGILDLSLLTRGEVKATHTHSHQQRIQIHSVCESLTANEK